ncbi:hypothetical protein K461DRAFT_173450 [Myriangium duriaei CBS 260.36]|uniref:Uncharacterized protein n=1 Tax=Myriangium duriaei CBS 260.36 TaxID=1168546 RepID=A0A9P4MFT2_9PEZI|nr:hypothetical protein K461DRAFT_173450 [Myriangium duriaei CBS 260.36]
MSSRVSRGQPAKVEDEDERGQPVRGTERVARSSVGPRPPPSRIDARSDSGYSSRTHGTIASADSAKALPKVPEPPSPEKADIQPALPPPPSAGQAAEAARPPLAASSEKKHARTSSKTSKASRGSKSSRSHPQPQRCTDPNCTRDHTPYPPGSVDAPRYYPLPVDYQNPHPDHQYPHPSNAHPSYWYSPNSAPIYDHPPQPPDRTLRRSSRPPRPSTYHEDMSGDWLYQRMGRAFGGHDSQETVQPPRRDSGPGYPHHVPHDQYSLREYYRDREPERPQLRHAITDDHYDRRIYVDPEDPYNARLHGNLNLIEYGSSEIPTRRRSVHGQPYTSSRAGRSRSRSRANRALVPRHQDPSPYDESAMPPPPGSLPLGYDAWNPPGWHGPPPGWRSSEHREHPPGWHAPPPGWPGPEFPVSHPGEPYPPAGRSTFSHSRTRSEAHGGYGESSRQSRRSSHASQDRRPSHSEEYSRRRMSSSRRSISPGHAQELRELRSARRASHSIHYDQERRVRRDSSRDYSPTEDKSTDALRYQDQVRGGPMNDDLTSAMRQTYQTSTRRPGLIAQKQPSVTSHTSSRSRRSAARPSDMHSTSSRRNSEYQVRVQIVNDGEEIQSYRLPIRGDKPLNFTVDEDGGISSQVRVDRPPSTSSRWSWLTGSNRSGRSRAASEHDVHDERRHDDRRGRRRMSIKSPIIERSREDDWGRR